MKNRHAVLLLTLGQLLSFSVPGALAQTQTQMSFFKGEHFLAVGKYPEAIAAFNEAILFDYKNSEAYLERARCYIAGDDIDRATADLSHFFALRPNSRDVTAFNRLAYCYAMKKNYHEAIKAYTLGIAVVPTYANSYRDRANCYRKIGDLQSAKADMDMFTRMGGASDTEQLMHTQAAIISQLPMRAKGHINQQVVRRAMFTEAEGEKLIRDKDRVSIQTQRIAQSSINGEAYLSRAEAYQNMKKYGNALADYDYLIAPENAHKFNGGCIESAFSAKAELLLKLGRYEEALASFKTISGRDKDSEEAKYGEGSCLLKLGKYEEAIVVLDDAVKASDGKLAKIYEARAQAHMALGHRELAMKDLQTSVSLRPEKK